ncbi:MAG: alpha/beta fold hydrolase [Pirellulales bacterium]
METPRLTAEWIVLLHGLGANARLMGPLERRLAAGGYSVLNWSYASLMGTIEEHGRRLHERLQTLDADASVARLHLVAHSMGSIVARYALGLGKPARLGRMVLLAPPNRGSRVAAWLGPWLRWGCRTIDQLAARPDSFVNQLPLPDEAIEIGVIAASIDALVACHSTHLPAQRDHIVVPALHSLMIYQPRVAREIVHFLAYGRFASSVA